MYDYRTCPHHFTTGVPTVLNCRTLTYFPNYFIDRDGHVYRVDTNEMVQPESYDYIILDGVRCSIDTLLIQEYIGFMTSSIVPRSERPMNQSHWGYRSSKNTYYVESIKPFEANSYLINGIEFKQIPIAEDRIVISRNGVAYDLGRGDFLMRHCNNGETTIYFRRKPSPEISEIAPIRDHYSIYQLLYMTYCGPIKKDDRLVLSDPSNLFYDISNIKLVTRTEFYRKLRQKQGGSNTWRPTFEQMNMVADAISKGWPNSEIANILELPYEDRNDKKRVASIVYKLRRQKNYYDELKEKYSLS